VLEVAKNNQIKRIRVKITTKNNQICKLSSISAATLEI